jgi:uncharacterized protein (DUF305 family)
MQRRPILAAAAVLAVCVALAAGVIIGARSSDGTASASPAETSVDVGFARDMQVHHAQAVDMSMTVRDAVDATADPELRTVAADIMLTQQQQIGQMYGWLSAWGRTQAGDGPMALMGGAHPTASPAHAADHGAAHARSDASSMPGMASDAELDRLSRLVGRKAALLPAVDDPAPPGRGHDGGGGRRRR